MARDRTRDRSSSKCESLCLNSPIIVSVGEKLASYGTSSNCEKRRVVVMQSSAWSQVRRSECPVQESQDMTEALPQAWEIDLHAKGLGGGQMRNYQNNPAKYVRKARSCFAS